MSSPCSARIRPSMPLIRALFAAIALISQLTLGSLVLPDEAFAQAGGQPGAQSATSELRAATILCGEVATARASQTHRHPHRHPGQTTARSPDGALELSAVILMPATTLAMLVIVSGAMPVRLPPAREPPAPLDWALHVRGPPGLA